jgi:hypothetical protein
MKRYFLKIIALFVLIGCSKKEDSVNIPLSSENFVLHFKISINGNSYVGNINDKENTITVDVFGSGLDNLSPEITISAKSSISPKSDISQNFNSPISYTVTSEDGSKRTYQVSVSNQNINDENQLLFFALKIDDEETQGIIDEEAKTVTFSVAGVDLSNLKPKIRISEHATISPEPSIAQDFNDVIAYTIIASDGTPAIYRVIVNNRPLSDDNKITFFSAGNGNTVSEATIDEEFKIISFNFGELDRSNLTVELTLPEYAIVFPEVDSTQDFTKPVIYEVTAENGDKRKYTVIANLPVISYQGFGNVNTRFFSGANIPVTGKFIDLSLPNSKLRLLDGTNKFPLEIVSTSNSFNGLIQNSRIVVKIPDTTPTNTNYKIIYEGDDFVYVSDYQVDINREDSPLPLSVDKAIYNYNDELVVTGENLTTSIGIPSLNGSFYLMDPRGSQITINADRTEMRVILDIRQLFPSYFGREAQEFNVSFFGSEGRVGRTIPATFE